MKYLPDLQHAMSYAGQFLRNTGQVITTESWQGIKEPIEMFEAFDLCFKCPIPKTFSELVEFVKPNLPWADDHFAERVSGIPYNPPPSAMWWPFAQQGHKAFKEGEKFSHTYPERFWPKETQDDTETKPFKIRLRYPGGNFGLRYRLGDLNDVIELLRREPHTRQAYLPVWFPEDTGAVQGQRVPCTLGYLFRVINGHIHITYKIRSCDYLRHFRDDIYMAIRLARHVLSELRKKDSDWENIELGLFKMQADSLHVFAHEKDKI